jgi:hypothetical protein
MTHLICCHSECGLPADFEIIEDRTDIHPSESVTHACSDHVGSLLGSVKEPHVFRWIVAALNPEESR